jgi:Carboxymuconolactone decarboxylase family
LPFANCNPARLFYRLEGMPKTPVLVLSHSIGTGDARTGFAMRRATLGDDYIDRTMAALGRGEEFAMHVRAGLQHEWEPCELKELLLQTAIYPGLPAANTAFHIGQKELEEAGLEPSNEAKK